MSAKVETRLTQLLRAALSHRTPLGAYHLAQLLTQQTGRRGYANTVYRIIAPLVASGEVIPIALVKGWVLAESCSRASLILLCERCHDAQQIPAAGVQNALHAICAANRFVPKRCCIEVLGVCQQCSQN